MLKSVALGALLAGSAAGITDAPTTRRLSVFPNDLLDEVVDVVVTNDYSSQPRIPRLHADRTHGTEHDVAGRDSADMSTDTSGETNRSFDLGDEYAATRQQTDDDEEQFRTRPTIAATVGAGEGVAQRRQRRATANDAAVVGAPPVARRLAQSTPERDARRDAGPLPAQVQAIAGIPWAAKQCKELRTGDYVCYKLVPGGEICNVNALGVVACSTL
jgi:hypothetical protein